MNRSDLDAIESEIRSGYWHLLESEWALLLIAYARHLEGQLDALKEAYDHRAEYSGERISELEAALSELLSEAADVDDRNEFRQAFQNAARVLRKGEQP